MREKVIPRDVRFHLPLTIWAASMAVSTKWAAVGPRLFVRVAIALLGASTNSTLLIRVDENAVAERLPVVVYLLPGATRTTQ